MSADNRKGPRLHRAALHLAPSERSLLKLWDEIDHTRATRGEAAATKLAESALKAAIRQELNDDAIPGRR